MQLVGDLIEFAFFHPFLSGLLPLGCLISVFLGACEVISSRREDE